MPDVEPMPIDHCQAAIHLSDKGQLTAIAVLSTTQLQADGRTPFVAMKLLVWQEPLHAKGRTATKICNLQFCLTAVSITAQNSSPTLPSSGRAAAMARVVVPVNIPISTTVLAFVNRVSILRKLPSRAPAHASFLSKNIVCFCTGVQNACQAAPRRS